MQFSVKIVAGAVAGMDVNIPTSHGIFKDIHRGLKKIM